MTALAQQTTHSPEILARCPACQESWSTSGTIRIAVNGLADEMFNESLRQRLPELCYARCGHCRSLIATDIRRNPVMLEEIYQQLPESYWQGLNAQIGFHRVIEDHLNRRGITKGYLWDIGCGSGNLLAKFGDRWFKAGIEPGLAAVERARDRGLDVRAGTASSLKLTGVADVATLIDVVEHLPNPEAELRAVSDMLRPGGIVVLFTGTADAWSSRFAGPRWYYLHCVGHVSVFSRGGLTALLDQLGFVGVESHRVEHPGGVGLAKWLRRIAGNAARRLLGRRIAAMHFYRDHQLVLASKPR